MSVLTASPALNASLPSSQIHCLSRFESITCKFSFIFSTVHINLIHRHNLSNALCCLASQPPPVSLPATPPCKLVIHASLVHHMKIRKAAGPCTWRGSGERIKQYNKADTDTLPPCTSSIANEDKRCTQLFVPGN